MLPRSFTMPLKRKSWHLKRCRHQCVNLDWNKFFELKQAQYWLSSAQMFRTEAQIWAISNWVLYFLHYGYLKIIFKSSLLERSSALHVYSYFRSSQHSGNMGFYMYFISDKNESYVWISKLYVLTWSKSKRRKICKRTLNSNTIYSIVCSCNLILYDNIDKPSPRQNPIYDISWLILQILPDIIIKLNFSKYRLASIHKL